MRTPGIDNTESTELQLHHINFESTDSESDTDNTILVNIITIENDYESIIYEQPFHSNIYENQLDLLHDYYTRPISNKIPAVLEVNGINTVIKPEKDQVQCSSTNKNTFIKTYKQNYQKKSWTIPFLLESRRNKEFQPPDLEIDFLIDSAQNQISSIFPHGMKSKHYIQT